MVLTNFYIDKEDLKKIKIIMIREGRHLSEFLRECIKNKIDRKNKSEDEK